MELKEMIYRRSSCRSYSEKTLDSGTLAEIKAFIGTLRPLFPDIKTRFEIIGNERVRCILPWTSPHYLAVFSEDTDGTLENAGFMLQQLDLYLQSLGLGACWLGMGKFHPSADDASGGNDGLKFIIMLAFGTPKEPALRKEVREFKRKPLSDISDTEDIRLEPARLAPSSVNSQPWYFTHDGNIIHAYCMKQGIFKQAAIGKFNRIDMGCVLAHMYIANAGTFEFFKAQEPDRLKNYYYTGSFRI